MVEAGAAGVHFEDQLAAEKKCGHLGGKVLVPTSQFVRTLTAARLAADVWACRRCSSRGPTRCRASLLTSDVDERDDPFATGERTSEGFFRVRDGLEAAIARGLAYAPYADVLWFETSTPGSGRGARVRRGDPRAAPGKLLAYNCSPSFNWKQASRRRGDRGVPARAGDVGYRFQFITLAGFHALNASMFELARGYREQA